MSAQEADANPVGWNVPTQTRPVRVLVRDWVEEGDFFHLSSPTNPASGRGHEEAGRNTREPRSSLVNVRLEETILYLIREVNNHLSRDREGRRFLSGYQGQHVSKESIGTGETRIAEGELVYKSRRRRDWGVMRESDKAIVVKIPRTNNLGGAKGLDLDRVRAGSEGTGDWR